MGTLVIMVSMGVGGTLGWLVSKILECRDRPRYEKLLVTQDAEEAFSKAAHEFVIVVCENHPELVHYDEELRELAERVAETREALHQSVHGCVNDGYRSPLRALLR